MNLKYSIVIPTYNNLETCLKPCLQSLTETCDLNEVEVIVVANGCTDDTRSYVNSLGNAFRLIWFNDAIGFTKATNIGIQQCNSDHIVIMNNDSVILNWNEPPNHWLKALAEPLADTQGGVSGPSRRWYCPETKTTGLRNGKTKGEWFVLFFLAMIHRRAIDKIGLLDEIFSPGYGEDIDFCLKVLREGMTVAQVPKNQDEWAYSTNFPVYRAAGRSFGENGLTLMPRAMDIITERWNSGYYGNRK